MLSRVNNIAQLLVEGIGAFKKNGERKANSCRSLGTGTGMHASKCAASFFFSPRSDTESLSSGRTLYNISVIGTRELFFCCHIMAVVIRHSRGAFFTALPYFRGNFHANVITFIQLLFSFSATQRPLPSVVASFQFVLSSKTITTTLTFTPGTSCF